MQLKPREIFTIVRGLEDHTDTATYYVRAVIRNARTDAIIDTVTLTDKGDRRFSGEWTVSADPAGYGIYIIITTSVYTDAGYTTKGIYGDTFDTYLIAERPNPVLSFGGGSSGPDLDYKKVRKIIAEEVAKIPKVEMPIIPKQKIVDISPLQKGLDGNSQDINDVRKQLNFIVDSLSIIKNTIDSLPKPEKVDFAPLQEAIDSNLANLNGELENIKTKMEENQQASGADLKDELQKNLEEVNKIVEAVARPKNTDKLIEEITGLIKGDAVSQPEVKPKKIYNL